jgi:hypothetical protein
MIGETKIAKELIESTSRPLADSAADIWGLILGDRLAFFRRKNAIALSKRLHEEAERLGTKIDPSRVPDQFAFEWGEAASSKNDSTIQDLFAQLLTAASMEGGSSDERLLYAVREMAPDDAVLFRLLYNARAFSLMSRDRGVPITHLGSIAGNQLKFGADLAIDNLLRISLLSEQTGLIDQSRMSRSLGGDKTPRIEIKTQRLIQPSALGKLLHQQLSLVATPANTADRVSTPPADKSPRPAP